MAACVVVGDGRPFVGALVTLDPEGVAAWASQHGREGATPEQLVDDPAVRAEVQAAVDRANDTVSSAEQVRRFVLLPVQWTEEGGQVTPSMKIKRRVVLAEHAADVDGLYAPRR